MALVDDLLQRHLARPVSRYVQSLRAKARAVNEILDGPAALDQYPGRRVPWIYTRSFRIDGPVVTRSTGALGRTVADPTTPLLPREGPINVGRNGTFTWTRASSSVYFSLTYAADPGGGAGAFGPVATFSKFGDIFDPSIDSNGGAVWSGAYAYAMPPALALTAPASNVPTFAFDIGLYDKLRGSYLHSTERLPTHIFSGQKFCNRRLQKEVIFDANTQMDVQLYVNEIKLGDLLETAQAIAAARLRTWVFLNFIGYIEQNDNYVSDTGKGG